MKLLEITTYRDAFGDTGAVIELQYGNRCKRVLFLEFGPAVNGLADVDFLIGNLDTFLGEKNTHAPRIWSGRAVVNLHYFSPGEPACYCEVHSRGSSRFELTLTRSQANSEC